MKIYGIQYKDENGTVLLKEKAFARKGFGLRDEPSEKPEREVTLTGIEIQRAIKDLDGFCTKKFVADILTEGLDYSVLVPGALVRAGDAVLEITSVGKKCFSDCPVENKPCELNRGCAFAMVRTEGTVSEGDSASVIPVTDGGH